MANITAAMVKELRESTGVGMMDAKKALVECDGNMDAAVDLLRTKGLAKAAKKSGRTAAEGLVCVAVSDDKKNAVVIEVNAETDFVARNEKFQNAVSLITQAALSSDAQDVDALGNIEVNGKAIKDMLTELIATIGENMQIRRFERVAANDGVIAHYIHGAIADNMGRIGVAIALNTTADAQKAGEIGRKVAMHIAAAKPESLTSADLSAERVEREKNVLREKAKTSGKPDDIIEKMLEGQIRKFYSEICLLDQTFVMDTDVNVAQFLAASGKDLGADITISSYSMYVLGEGIEKEEDNFAEEVRNAVNG